MKTILFALILAASAQAAAHSLPEKRCVDYIPYSESAGTSCVFAEESLTVADVMAANAGDIAKLVEGGYHIRSIRMEIVESQSRLYSNTKQYTFLSYIPGSLAIRRPLQGKKLVLSVKVDSLAPGRTRYVYESSGVSEFTKETR